MNNFDTYWDTRIDRHQKLFDEKPGLANFLYDEALLAYEQCEKDLSAQPTYTERTWSIPTNEDKIIAWQCRRIAELELELAELKENPCGIWNRDDVKAVSKNPYIAAAFKQVDEAIAQFCKCKGMHKNDNKL